MSTTPSSIATEVTAAATELATAATEALTTGETGAAAGFDSIKEIMDNFDPAALLPELDSVAELVTTVAGFAVVIGPAVLLVMGLAYLLLAPKEANYRFGYRCFFGMGSVEAWRYTQRIAGALWTLVGGVLTAIGCFLALGYGGKEIVAVVDSAVTLLLWELGLTVLSILIINGLVMFNFNAKGTRRRR